MGRVLKKGEAMPNYMFVLIPLIVGVIVLSFPQVFTSKDLNKKENLPTKRTMQIIGIIAIIASVVFFL
jgi:hypothetical protein